MRAYSRATSGGGSVRVDRRVAAGREEIRDAVFSGSIIRQGEIGALVYATGSSTYFGKTAQLVRTRTVSATSSVRC